MKAFQLERPGRDDPSRSERHPKTGGPSDKITRVLSSSPARHAAGANTASAAPLTISRPDRDGAVTLGPRRDPHNPATPTISGTPTTPPAASSSTSTRSRVAGRQWDLLRLRRAHQARYPQSYETAYSGKFVVSGPTVEIKMTGPHTTATAAARYARRGAHPGQTLYCRTSRARSASGWYAVHREHRHAEHGPRVPSKFTDGACVSSLVSAKPGTSAVCLTTTAEPRTPDSAVLGRRPPSARRSSAS
jgi:hypothetical protein